MTAHEIFRSAALAQRHIQLEGEVSVRISRRLLPIAIGLIGGVIVIACVVALTPVTIETHFQTPESFVAPPRGTQIESALLRCGKDDLPLDWKQGRFHPQSAAAHIKDVSSCALIVRLRYRRLINMIGS